MAWLLGSGVVGGAVLVARRPERPGRPIDECIEILKDRGSRVAPDEEFAKDMNEILKSRTPLDTSSWG